MADTSGPGSHSIPPKANFKAGFKLPAPGALAPEVREEFPRTRSEGSHGVPADPAAPRARSVRLRRFDRRAPPPQSPESPGRPGRAAGARPGTCPRARVPVGPRGSRLSQRADPPPSPSRSEPPKLTSRRGGSQDPAPGAPHLRGFHACHMSANNNKLSRTFPSRPHAVPGAARPSGLGDAGSPPTPNERSPGSSAPRSLHSLPARPRPAAHPEGAAAEGGSAPAGLRAPLSRAAASSAEWEPQRLAAPGGGGPAAGWKRLAPAAASAGSGDGEVDGQGGEAAARKSGCSGSWSSSTLRTLRSCRRRQSARSRPALPGSRSSPAAPAAGAPLPWRAPPPPPPPPASGLAAAAPGNPDDEARSPAAAAIFSRGLHSLVPAGEGGGGESAGGGRSGGRVGGRALLPRARARARAGPRLPARARERGAAGGRAAQVGGQGQCGEPRAGRCALQPGRRQVVRDRAGQRLGGSSPTLEQAVIGARVPGSGRGRKPEDSRSVTSRV